MTAAAACFRIVVSLLAIASALALARVAATTGLRVPLDPNEGWNAYHALHAMSGAALYPPAGSLTFNNYPPLSFYIVGAAGRLTGDFIMAGRMVSLLAVLAIAGEIYVSCRLMNTDRWSALFPAVLFVAGLLLFSDYAGMDDPQLLAHAIALAGLAILLRWPRDAWAIVAAALLLVLAAFAKHNLVALPVALAAWLLLQRRPSALLFVASGLSFAVAGLAAFRLLYGSDLFAHLNSPRLYTFAGLVASLSSWLLWCGIALAGMVLLAILRARDRHVRLCALYSLTALSEGILFAGGGGVDINIWFDAAIALSLGAGLLLRDLGTSGKRRALAGLAYCLPLLAGLWLQWNPDWTTRRYWLHPLEDDAAAASADIAYLTARRGPALCEDLALCYWAGKDEEADVFNLGQAYASRARDAGALAGLVERRRFAVMQFDSLDPFALGAQTKSAVLRAYRVDRTSDNGVFLVPR
ncbi:MAG TPA: hypothetical protein VG819_12320 [Rhizomicrobium sp.]|nr:hypothetical protein [Rhizomicrobium sp.]